MKPIHQTTFGQDNGNCFSACIASILEVPLGTVPNFCKDSTGNWRENTNIWLAQFGLAYIDIHLAGDLRDNLVDYWGYHVIAGKGPRGVQHAIVGYKGVPYFDPHPSGKMLLPDQELEYGLFISRMQRSEPPQMISQRVNYCKAAEHLARHGILTVETLLGTPLEDLFQVRSFGATSLMNTLSQLDLGFSTEEKRVVLRAFHRSSKQSITQVITVARVVQSGVG
jgi:hypothetical protein